MDDKLMADIISASNDAETEGKRAAPVRILSNDSQQTITKLRAHYGLVHSFIVPQFRNGRLTMNGANVRNRQDTKRDRILHYTRNPGAFDEPNEFDEIYTTHRKAT